MRHEYSLTTNYRSGSLFTDYKDNLFQRNWEYKTRNIIFQKSSSLLRLWFTIMWLLCFTCSFQKFWLCPGIFKCVQVCSNWSQFYGSTEKLNIFLTHGLKLQTRLLLVEGGKPLRVLCVWEGNRRYLRGKWGIYKETLGSCLRLDFWRSVSLIFVLGIFF